MAIGAFQAVLAASPAKFPVPVLEARCQALQLWDQRLKQDPNFESIAVANPPGVAPTGLRIAVNMLMGKQVNKSKLGGANGLSFVIPVPVTVTKDNFQQVFTSQCSGKPPAYLLDGIMTDQEVQQYFQ
jgi:ribose transport system substrate-binding protein